jgi:hypothetical protein
MQLIQTTFISIFSMVVLFSTTLQLTFPCVSTKREDGWIQFEFFRWLNLILHTYFLLIGDGSLFIPVEKAHGFSYYLKVWIL